MITTPTLPVEVKLITEDAGMARLMSVVRRLRERNKRAMIVIEPDGSFKIYRAENEGIIPPRPGG